MNSIYLPTSLLKCLYEKKAEALDEHNCIHCEKDFECKTYDRETGLCKYESIQVSCCCSECIKDHDRKKLVFLEFLCSEKCADEWANDSPDIEY